MQQISEQVKQRVSATIMESMDCGGTLPAYTVCVLAEDSPEILVELSMQELTDLCDEIQRSEVVEETRRLQELFGEFNRRYFAGSLPEYEVRVVYDIALWAGLPFYEGDTGVHQPELRRILIRISHDYPLASVLLHEMAHAAVGEDHDDNFLREMQRLRDNGAPIENLDGYEDIVHR